jgi:predicted AAA+ superfamily ATPase
LHFNNYLEFGAFPRVVLEKDNELKQEVLRNYFWTIYLKDIIYPNNLRNNKDVFDLLYFVISNIAKPFSYSNIAKTLGISSETVKEYIQYAEDSYLIYLLTKYDNSIKKQLANPKKIYCTDTGLVNSISFKFSQDKGWLLENLIFMTLKKQNMELYYHKKRYECDFLIKDALKITGAVQVSLTLEDESTKNREIRGLMEAMNIHNLQQGLIITQEESGKLRINDKEIQIIPVYEWLDSKR